jgi:hypothetical protein
MNITLVTTFKFLCIKSDYGARGPKYVAYMKTHSCDKWELTVH